MILPSRHNCLILTSFHICLFANNFFKHDGSHLRAAQAINFQCYWKGGISKNNNNKRPCQQRHVYLSGDILTTTTVDWSLNTQIKQWERNVVLGWAGVCGEGRNTSSPKSACVGGYYAMWFTSFKSTRPKRNELVIPVIRIRHLDPGFVETYQHQCHVLWKASPEIDPEYESACPVLQIQGLREIPPDPPSLHSAENWHHWKFLKRKNSGLTFYLQIETVYNYPLKGRWIVVAISRREASRYTAISEKVVGKSARDNPERYWGRIWDHCSS